MLRVLGVEEPGPDFASWMLAVGIAKQRRGTQSTKPIYYQARNDAIEVIEIEQQWNGLSRRQSN